MADELSTLADAAYEGILFPVESAPTDSGHDAAEHTAYGRRGADIEPCGRQADRGTMTIPFINTPALVARYGVLFPDLYRTVRALFEDLPIGRLMHPTRGEFRALIKSWHEELSADSRSGVTVRVEWVENNASVSVSLDSDGTPVADPATTVASNAATADVEMAKALPAGGYVPVKDGVDSELTYLQSASRTFAEVGSALRTMLDLANANLALEVLQAAAAFDAVNALEALRASIYALQAVYQPRAAEARTYTLTETMAAWQVAQIVYGDASRDGLLLAANAIPDPLSIGAGTVLTILPDTSA